jgi:hypothetical protein
VSRGQRGGSHTVVNLSFLDRQDDIGMLNTKDLEDTNHDLMEILLRQLAE